MVPLPCTSNAPRDPNTFFRRVGLSTLLVVLAGMGYYGWAVFSPSTIPYNVLGPLGTLTKYLVNNHKTLFPVGYMVACLTHLVEAIYAVRVCKSKGINDSFTQFKWFFQTTLVGMFSLRFLLAYKPPRSRQ